MLHKHIHLFGADKMGVKARQQHDTDGAKQDVLIVLSLVGQCCLPLHEELPIGRLVLDYEIEKLCHDGVEGLDVFSRIFRHTALSLKEFPQLLVDRVQRQEVRKVFHVALG